MHKKFVVEGHYVDPEDGSMTTDFVLAKDGDSAAIEVGRARKFLANGWHVSAVNTFDDYIAELERVASLMRGMSDADVRNSWFETKASLVPTES